MIESPFHPCDEITRFGFTAHGVATGIQTGTRRLIVNGASFPLPFDWPFQAGVIAEPYDTHLVKVPDQPSVDLPPEVVAAEAAAGRTWQHYALLSEDRLVLFGKVLSGWVCIDPDGKRWLIRTMPHINRSIVSGDQPLTLQVSAVPFGYLDEEPVAAVSQSITLSDLGQGGGYQAPPSGSSDPQALMLRVGSVASHGRKVVIELHGVESLALAATRRVNTAPAGFLLLELSGPGPLFTLSLTVLRTRQQVLGTYVEQRTRPLRCGLRMQWSSVETPSGAGVDVVTTPTDGETYEVVDTVSPLFGSGWIGDERTGRIAALLFDDQDQLVELSYDARLRVNYSYPAWQKGSLSGDARGWLPNGVDYTTSNVTSTVAGEFVRTSTEHLTGEIVVRRNGAVISTGRLFADCTYAERATITAPATPDLQRQGGKVVSSVAIAYHSTITRSTTVDEGAGQVTWDRSPPGDQGANTGFYALWSSLTNSPTAKPYSYGATVEFGSNSSEQYSGGLLTLQRLSNNLLGVIVRAKAGTSPTKYRVPGLAAPQGQWINPAGVDPSTRQATYHPYTHEIFTTAGGAGINTPFVWV